jgi:hypothetical protein
MRRLSTIGGGVSHKEREIDMRTNKRKEVTKMKRMAFFLLLSALIFGLTGVAAADTDSDSHDVLMNVNEIAVMELNDSSQISLTVVPPTLGGDPPVDDSDNSKLLHYTSVVASGNTRTITAEWGPADAAPAGTSLKLEATGVPANCGSAAGQIDVSNSATTIISGIGSCATGRGANGAELTYTLSVDDAAQLVAGDSQTATITLTLTEDS